MSTLIKVKAEKVTVVFKCPECAEKSIEEIEEENLTTAIYDGEALCTRCDTPMDIDSAYFEIGKEDHQVSAINVVELI